MLTSFGMFKNGGILIELKNIKIKETGANYIRGPSYTGSIIFEKSSVTFKLCDDSDNCLNFPGLCRNLFENANKEINEKDAAELADRRMQNVIENTPKIANTNEEKNEKDATDLTDTIMQNVKAKTSKISNVNKEKIEKYTTDLTDTIMQKVKAETQKMLKELLG